MCGIVGVFGTKRVLENTILGLKKLEYRGYDSWGLGFLKNDKIILKKEIGKISQAENDFGKIFVKAAIGHTRWATHGKVDLQNAHPQVDCKENLAVVHNGIIENYSELKNDLIKNGHKFISQTDTEVIPHLLEENLKRHKFLSAIITTCQKLKGNYSFVVLEKKSEKLFAVANGCPLIYAQNDNKYIASDILAFPKDIKEVVFLKNGTISEIGKDFTIYDINCEKKKKIEFKKISFIKNDSSLRNYKHFLFKEINEQPEILEKIAKFDQKEIETNAALIRNSYGTFIVACGTALHAGMVGEYFFAINSKMHLNTISAGEFSNFENFITEKTLFFAISQSGETADVLEAVKVAQRKKAKIFTLINNPNSTLSRESHISMITPAGPEIAVLSTKAFTSQVAILYLLSKAITNELSAARIVLQKAADAVSESLDTKNISKIKNLARKLSNSRDIFLIGRGLNFPTALEAALKIKEVSYIHAEGFSGADLKHGPIALIEKGTPCIVFAAEDDAKDDILSNAMEVKARGAYVIGVSSENNSAFDEWIKVADISEISPILNIIPMQVLSYFLAVEKNLDPDKPRNLAKSVTVK